MPIWNAGERPLVHSVVRERALVDAIQAILSELDRIENEHIDEFGRGRIFGIREVGGEDLVTAVEAKEDARITKIVRETMIKMDTRTREIQAATPPAPLSREGNDAN
jgi:hypothetical protein